MKTKNHEQESEQHYSETKGYWIPIKVWRMAERGEINFNELRLLLEVDGLVKVKGVGCWASNEYLAERLGMSPNHVSAMVSHLKELKLLIEVGWVMIRNLRHRILETIWTKALSEGPDDTQEAEAVIEAEVRKQTKAKTVVVSLLPRVTADRKATLTEDRNPRVTADRNRINNNRDKSKEGGAERSPPPPPTKPSTNGSTQHNGRLTTLPSGAETNGKCRPATTQPVEFDENRNGRPSIRSQLAVEDEASKDSRRFRKILHDHRIQVSDTPSGCTDNIRRLYRKYPEARRVFLWFMDYCGPDDYAEMRLPKITSGAQFSKQYEWIKDRWLEESGEQEPASTIEEIDHGDGTVTIRIRSRKGGRS